jgi:hypothetical protein
MPTNKPLLLAQSIIAGLTAALGTAGLTDILPANLVFGLVVLVGAVHAGIGYYQSHDNTSSNTVVATQPILGGAVIAGPASAEDIKTGSELDADLTIGEVSG